MTGRKPKYSQELANLIVEVISQTGSDKAAYSAVGIRAGTYYRWLNEKSEFSERVARAKEDFSKTAPEAFISQANQILYDYLFTGHVETWTAREVHRDTAGNIIKTVERVSKVVKPTPPWAIDRVLGKNMPVLEAMQVLLTEGVATPDQARIITQGISQIERDLKNLTSSNGASDRASAGAIITSPS